MNDVLKLVEEGNPWVPYEYSKRIQNTVYGPYAGTFYPWAQWERELDTPVGMQFEMRNKKTGKIKKTNFMTAYIRQVVEQEDKGKFDREYAETAEEIDLDALDVVIIWTHSKGYGENRTPDIYVNADLIEYRIEDKLLRKTAKIMQTVQVGDFVKCKGTRSGDWNKVEQISECRTGVYGPKYSKPEEGFMRYTSSSNGMEKIMKIVRNGKELEL